jgi:hypothetical protein
MDKNCELVLSVCEWRGSKQKNKEVAMNRLVCLVVCLLIGWSGLACSQGVVLHKRVGDEVRLSVSIAGAPVHRFVGCDVVYPAWVMEPVVTEGNKVSFVAGSVYGGMDTETLCTKGSGSVSLSRVLKSGAAVAQNGSVATILFKCVAAGTGVVSISDAAIGYIEDGGAVVKYYCDAESVNVQMVSPATVTFTISVQ